MGREEQLLAEAIKECLFDASKAESKLSRVLESYHSVDDVEGNDDEEEMAGDTISWYVTKLYRDVGIFAERMLLPLLASSIATEFNSHKLSDLRNMDLFPHDFVFHSPHLSAIRAHFNSIAVMTDGKAITSLGIFRSILENTPLIIEQRKLVPTNEKEVRQAVFDYLKVAFHDAVREIPIPHLFKTFRPDLGVRSLMAAAEYKFVQSEEELKIAIEGIFADMKGYKGSDWRTFFAVFYCTKAVANKERLVAEFEDVNEDHSWAPIIVTGPGERKK